MSIFVFAAFELYGNEFGLAICRILRNG